MGEAGLSGHYPAAQPIRLQLFGDRPFPAALPSLPLGSTRHTDPVQASIVLYLTGELTLTQGACVHPMRE